MTARGADRAWPLIVLAVGLLTAVIVRLLLLPTDGLRGDLDQFVLWVHGLASQPFGQAYDQNLSFPPVMVYVWGVLAALEPAFRTVTEGADPAIRAVMKAPASVADLAIGLLLFYQLRDRVRWAVTACLAFVLLPAVVDVSAWWGQYESIYVLGGLVAYMLAVRGHASWAAAALAVALMTKPQALPFLVPFAAWFVARGGLRGLVRAGLVGLAVIVVLWLPFVAAGGPGNYLGNLATYQGDIFAILSIRAWNAWWLVQEAFAGGQFVSDQGALFGPFTLRHLGLLVTGLLEIAVFVAVYRRPSARTLALGLAAAVLVAFTFLTTMHERYAYGALVFLALLLPEPRIRRLWLALAAVFTLNLLAAVPPTPDIGSLVPVAGPLGVLGSLAMLAITLLVLRELLVAEPSVDAQSDQPPEPAGQGDAIPVEVVG